MAKMFSKTADAEEMPKGRIKARMSRRTSRISSLLSMSLTSRIFKFGKIGLGATLVLSITGCHKEVSVVKKMSWACEPGWDSSSHPGMQSVRFRYLDTPAYSELIPGLGLCDELELSGKPIVEVRFDLFGNSWKGMRGYRIVEIGGRPYVRRGGFGSSRVEGPSPGPDPFAGFIPRHHLF